MRETVELEETDEDWKRAGFSARRAESWQVRGFNIRAALEWSKHFSPESATEWSEAMFTADEARAWKLEGFTLESALSWLEVGFDRNEAIAWSAADCCDPEVAAIWRGYGFGPLDAAECRARGLSPKAASVEREAACGNVMTQEIWRTGE